MQLNNLANFYAKLLAKSESPALSYVAIHAKWPKTCGEPKSSLSLGGYFLLRVAF
jgi:hypothetical protein